MSVRFSRRELKDLAVAWLALGLAFTFFLERDLTAALLEAPGTLRPGRFAATMALSLATVGVAFLLHELGHKVVAVRFGQLAEFRADYGMLFLAVASGIAGFLFAAPGAVYHRGRITERENGLIALAGPAVNVLLAVAFFPLVFVLPEVGNLGVFINVLLAGFNMLPFGPLDGRSVLRWNKLVFAAAFVPTAGLALLLLLGPRVAL